MSKQSDIQHMLETSHHDAIERIRDVDPQLVVYEESGWRVKDIIAHVVTWETELLRCLHAYRRGGAYHIPNYETDDFNGYAATMKADMELDTIVADWEAVRKWFGIHISAITTTALEDQMMMPWGKTARVREMFIFLQSHLEEHLQDIRAKVALDQPHSSE